LDTDYAIHINNGSEDVKPIVLRLLPGEETIFELLVVNHGDPSNISVDASPPIIKAMRLKRANHYVEMEERIPVLARMPNNVDRLDGEIVVTSENGTSKVPISLVSEAEGSEEDDEERDEGEEPSVRELEDDDREDGLEDKSEDEEVRDASDADVDVQNYRSASSRRGVSSDGMGPRRMGPQDYDSSRSYEKTGTTPRKDSRSQWNQEYGPAHRLENEGPYYSKDSDESSAQETSYQSTEEVEDEGSEGLFGLDRAGNLIQVIPGIMLILIIAVLVLTFYTETIPEFLGALASSILIVTLIIYGAATLLKA
jgi:hypothetical protein